MRCLAPTSVALLGVPDFAITIVETETTVRHSEAYQGRGAEGKGATRALACPFCVSKVRAGVSM